MAAAVVALGSARAADPVLPPDDEAGPRYRLHTLVEGGSAVAIGSRLGALPQAGAYRDLPGAWQAGVQARFALGPARVAYDYLPMASVSLRKLWLGDEDVAPIRNSEYFGVSLGAYFSYDFQGGRGGPRPMGSILLGKYWMPFESSPWGLDLSLDLTTLKLPFFTSGHLPGHSEQIIVACAANLFYAFR